MIVPFLIIYLFNWVMFFIIIVSLLRKNYQSNTILKKDTKTVFLYQHLIIAITLSLLFGLGWSIGLFATQDIHTNKTVRDIFAALFVVFTAFHGLFIFIMQCLRSKDVRNSWKRCFLGVTRRDISEITSSRISQKHQKEHEHSSKTKFVVAAKNPSVFVNEYAAMRGQSGSGKSDIAFHERSNLSHSRALVSVTEAEEEKGVVGFAETPFNKAYLDEIDDHEEKELGRKKSDIIYTNYHDGFTYVETASIYFN